MKFSVCFLKRPNLRKAYRTETFAGIQLHHMPSTNSSSYSEHKTDQQTKLQHGVTCLKHVQTAPPFRRTFRSRGANYFDEPERQNDHLQVKDTEELPYCLERTRGTAADADGILRYRRCILHRLRLSGTLWLKPKTESYIWFICNKNILHKISNSSMIAKINSLITL